MTAQSIMRFRLVTLRPTDKVSHALKLMHLHQVRNLPVVDDKDQFLGLFGIRRVVELLLPTAAVMDLGLKDLSFMPDDLAEMHERLLEAGDRQVDSFYMKKKNLLFCKPTTSFPEVLELLHESRDLSLPVIVVKGKKNKLVGMVSAWDVLEKMVLGMLADEPPPEALPEAGAQVDQNIESQAPPGKRDNAGADDPK